MGTNCGRSHALSDTATMLSKHPTQQNAHLVSQIIVSRMQTHGKQDAQLAANVRNEGHNATCAQCDAPVTNADTIACNRASATKHVILARHCPHFLSIKQLTAQHRLHCCPNIFPVIKRLTLQKQRDAKQQQQDKTLDRHTHHAHHHNVRNPGLIRRKI